MEEERPFATLGNYEIVKFLGGDNISKVKLGRDPENLTVHAIKLFKHENLDEQKAASIEKEVNILQAMDHPNIIQFGSANFDATYVKKNGKSYQAVAFTMEYAERGNLFEYLYQTGNFSEGAVRFYFQQLIEGVEYCHNNGLCHRNLKLDNLLLDSNFQLKVSGFGLSTLVEGHFGSKFLTTRVGNEAYMAPELFQGEVYNGPLVDIFACGIILFALLSRRTPFDKADKKFNVYYKLVVEKKWDKFWQVQEKELAKAGTLTTYSPDFKNLIQGMLAHEIGDRYTLSTIKQHPWYNGPAALGICLATELDNKLKIIQQNEETQALEHQKNKELKKQLLQVNQINNESTLMQAFVGFKPFRSAGDTANEEELAVNKEVEQAVDFSLQRKLPEFPVGTLPKARTQIFITSDVKSVFTSLYLACKAELTDFSVSKSHYKIKGRVVKDKGNCNLEVVVNKVGEDSVCIEFLKSSGDMILFYNVVDKIKERLPITTETKEEKTEA